MAITPETHDRVFFSRTIANSSQFLCNVGRSFLRRQIKPILTKNFVELSPDFCRLEIEDSAPNFWPIVGMAGVLITLSLAVCPFCKRFGTCHAPRIAAGCLFAWRFDNNFGGQYARCTSANQCRQSGFYM